MIMLMEYPNRNLQYIMQKEADRAIRDYEMFAESIVTSKPVKKILPRITFKHLSQNIADTFTAK